MDSYKIVINYLRIIYYRSYDKIDTDHKYNCRYYDWNLKSHVFDNNLVSSTHGLKAKFKAKPIGHRPSMITALVCQNCCTISRFVIEKPNILEI